MQKPRSNPFVQLAIFFLVFTLVWGGLFDRYNSRSSADKLYPLWTLGLSLLLAAGLLWFVHRLAKKAAVRTFIKVGLGEITPKPVGVARPHGYLRWGIAGLLFLLAMFCLLEVHQPLFFSQDDNFFIGQPIIIAAYRSLLHGIFPAWTPYQYMGLPVASNPQSLIFYPPAFISYLLARFLFGNECYLNEVFTIGHLLAIFVATLCLLRRLNIRPLFAVMGSLSLVLSGYSLILGRSWSNQPGYLLLLMLLCWQTITLCEGKVGWKWVLVTGAGIGFFWHLGNAQLWIYTLGLFGISLLLLCNAGSLPWRKTLLLIPALCVAMVIMAPLLIPQLRESSRVISQRVVDVGEGIEFGTLSSLLPYPLSQLPYQPTTIRATQYGPFQWVWMRHYPLLGHFFYSGTLFYLITLAFFLLAFGIPFTKKMAAKSHWLVMAFFTWMLALGPTGLLWLLLEHLPVLGKMRGPFKLLGFLNLFVIIGACLVLERLFHHYRWKSWLAYGLFGALCLLLCYHCALPLPAFYLYGDHTYTPLPVQYREIVARSASPWPQRVYGSSPFRTPETGFVHAFNGNFASYYRIPTLDGFDALYQYDHSITMVQDRISANPLDATNYAAYRAYGVAWLVVQAEWDFPVVQDRAYIQQVIVVPSTSKLVTKIVKLQQTPDPLAFANDDPRQALPIVLRGDGALINIPAGRHCTRVTLNFTRQPFLKLFAGGRALPTGTDAWGRLHAPVPPGVQELRLAYVLPWGQGWLIALLFALFAPASYFFIVHIVRLDEHTRGMKHHETAVVRSIVGSE